MGLFSKISDSVHELKMTEDEKVLKEIEEKKAARLAKFVIPEFGDLQVKEIKKAIEHGLSDEQIKVIATLDNNEYEMKEIRLGFEMANKGIINEKYVLLYAKPSFNEEQMEAIRRGVELANDPSVDIENILSFVDKRFSADQMDIILDGYKLVKEGAFTQEQVKLFADAKYDNEIMKMVMDDVREGLTLDQIHTYLDGYSRSAMEKLELKKIRNSILEIFIKGKTAFEKNLMTKEQYDYFKVLKRGELEKAYKYFVEYKISVEQAGIVFSDKYAKDQKDVVARAFSVFNSGVITKEQLDSVIDENNSTEKMDKFLRGFENALTQQQLEYCENGGFTKEELVQIIEMFKLVNDGKLDMDTLKKYADTDYSEQKAEILEQVKIGFANGLSDEQVYKFADKSKSYSIARMIISRENLEAFNRNERTDEELELIFDENLDEDGLLRISEDFKFGLKKHQILVCENKNNCFSDEQRTFIRESYKLVNCKRLNDRQVEFIAVDAFSVDEMKEIRKLFVLENAKNY